MSKQIANSLFIDSSIPRFYQQLLASIGTYEELGTRIVKQIKLLHSFRRTDQVRELSHILANFPIKEYRLIGRYYLLWCSCREKKYHAYILENVIEQSQTYKTRALQSRAAIEVYHGNFTNAIHFYAESFKTRPSISEYIETTKAIAFIKSVEGFHDLSLKDLERLVPILCYAEPFAYYDILNSYAVELGEAGRKGEARNIIKHVLASPFAPAYPEWQETAQELKEPDRSLVSVRSIKRQQAIVRHHASKEAEADQPGRIVPFPPLKEAPEPEKPERIKSNEIGDMNLADKKEFLMTAIRTGAIPESEYTKMMYMLGLVDAGPAKGMLDLEDKTTLNELMIEWAHVIDPEELAGVLSALRDCEDDFRRNSILDSMIRKAFEYSRTCNITEAEWRLKVERSLPEK
ncbi:MAG TPA: hypothetical protein VF762_20305 [Blastocatellia bacterium]